MTGAVRSLRFATRLQPEAWASLAFAPVKNAVAEGRAAIQAEATVHPPPDGRLRLSPVPLEPDAVRLVVDAEHGFLIAYEAFIDGQPTQTGRLVELRVDEQLPQGTFVFKSPTGERPVAGGSDEAEQQLAPAVDEGGEADLVDDDSD